MSEARIEEQVGSNAGFASPLGAVDDAVACADALTGSIGAERRVIADRFTLVATWADFHCPDLDVPAEVRAGWSAAERAHRLRERAQAHLAAEGTPPVAPAAVVELGMLLGTSTGAATALLRDVLELRHRLPGHWDAVQGGHIDGWKARQVAVLTRRLTLDQAHRVDAQVLEAVTGLPWGRAKAVVEGRVIAVDKAAHAARLAEEENRRFVSTRRRSNTAGLRTLIARGDAGDIARLEAMIAHLATLLTTAGDSSHLDIRRAKALAMLANPALTCLFLTQAHQASKADRVDQASKASEADADAAAEAGVELDPDLELELDPEWGLALPPEPEPAPEPQPAGDEPEEGLSGPSAVELAVAFGQILQQLGAKALDRLRPRSVLYLHLAAEAVQGLPETGSARVEDPLAGGPISTDQLKAWLANDQVTVKPVLDPTGVEPVDDYEIPLHLREAVRLLHPYETCPWGTQPTDQADIDHSIPYKPMDKGGPPGQTALDNLGPLGRRHHLTKTFHGLTVHQLTPTLYLWRTPTGHWYQVDHRGTRPLGRYPSTQHPDTARPRALETALRHDPTPMSPLEKRLRDHLIHHIAS